MVWKSFRQPLKTQEKNAELNGIENAEFFVGKAEEVLPAKYKEDGVYADVIVVDPPRKGCDGALIETMLSMKPERIVYVSCDSATLARDLKVLCAICFREACMWRLVCCYKDELCRNP